jgi:hypothetical protein
MPKAASTLFADESADLTHEVAQVVADPEAWLHTPNVHLGGEHPIYLLGTPEGAAAAGSATRHQAWDAPMTLAAGGA